MKEFKDYNLISNSIDDIFQFSKNFYLNLQDKTTFGMEISICNHGYYFQPDILDLQLKPYNVTNVPGFGCNLREGYKLCFIGNGSIDDGRNLLNELKLNRLFRINCILSEIKKLGYRLNLDLLEQAVCKLPHQLNTIDLAIGLYHDNKIEFNKKNIRSAQNVYNAVLDTIDKSHPDWYPTLERALDFLDSNASVYIANLPHTSKNVSLIASNPNIIGIVCNTSLESERGWVKEANNINKLLVHGSGSKV